MPSVSQKQHNFMEAVAHNPAFAKKAGVPQKVGKDFAAADKAKGDAERANAAYEARPSMDDAPMLDDAKRSLDASRAELARLEAARVAHHTHEVKRNSTATRIAALRADSAIASDKIEDVDAVAQTVAEAQARCDSTRTEIARLEAALARARSDHADATREREAAQLRVERNEQTIERARSLSSQADEMEKILAEAAPPHVTDDEIAAAKRAVESATTQTQIAIEADETERLGDAARAAVTTANELIAAAKRLDVQVVTLDKDAPRELLAGCEGVEGLTIFDDDVGIDGIAIETMSGANRWRMCVDVARLVGAKGRVMICNEGEAIDSDQLGAFADHATRGGYTLVMARVTRGEVTMRTPAEEAAALDEERRVVEALRTPKAAVTRTK